MKKVIILAYDFPPYISVGGLRPYSWYKYMHEFNIYPIVITRQWDNKHGNHLDYISSSKSSNTIIEETEYGTLIKTSYKPNMSNRLMIKYGYTKFKLIRKVISAYYEFAQFLFLIGTKSQLYFSAKKYLSHSKADVIIATGEPFVLFKYASQLSREYNIPWIADYRDPWTQDKSRGENKLRKIWDKYFEKKYLSNASSIITVSSFFKKQISDLLPNKKYQIIPNGYDSEAIEKAKEIIQDNKNMNIAFVGTIYDWHPLESFFRVSYNFVKEIENPCFQINFYGVNIETKIKGILQSKFRDLIPFVNIHPKLPNELLVQKLARENLFLLFNYYSYMGTKIYDYLALKRQIILCYSDDREAHKLKEKYYNMDEFQSKSGHLQDDLITKTKSGIVVKDAFHLGQLLADFYTEFQNKGFIECNSVNVEQFSRKIQVEKLSRIIKEIKQT